MRDLKMRLDGLPGYKIRYSVHKANGDWEGWREAPSGGGEGPPFGNGKINGIKIELIKL